MRLCDLNLLYRDITPTLRATVSCTTCAQTQETGSLSSLTSSVPTGLCLIRRSLSVTGGSMLTAPRRKISTSSTSRWRRRTPGSRRRGRSRGWRAGASRGRGRSSARTRLRSSGTQGSCQNLREAPRTSVIAQHHPPLQINKAQKHDQEETEIIDYQRCNRSLTLHSGSQQKEPN